jgi:hypothetical protein
MMYLKPDGRIDLEHRSLFLRGDPFRSNVVSAAEDGRMSILSPDLKRVRSLQHSTRIRAVSPNPSGQGFAVVEDGSGSLIVQDHAGRLLELAAPDADKGEPGWFERGFGDCFFDRSGAFLWLAARRSAEEIEIRLIETAAWSLVARATVGDPFRWSSCSFHPTGRPGLLSLWLAAGQDGQQVYWLEEDRGGISCTLEPRLTNSLPPVFSPGGERLLVVGEDGAICQYGFPGMHRIGPPLISGDEDDQFAVSLAYLDEGRALAASNEQRIFLIDTARMKVEEEVALEGHEPRPIAEYDPALGRVMASEQGSGTDIVYFEGLGDAIFFVYRREGGIGSP